MKTSILVGLFIALSLVSVANADTISYTEALVPNPQLGDIHTILNLPQFDPSLGTLTGVQITVNGSVAASAKYENTNTVSALGATTARMRLNLTQELVVAMGEQTLLTMTHATANDYYSNAFEAWLQNIPSGALTVYDGTTDYAGPSGFTTPLWDVPGSAVYSPSDFAAFVGAGTLAVNVDTTSNTMLLTYGGNVSSGVESLFGTSVTVGYTYDVPEPATMSLLALGALAMLRRNRK